MINHYDRAAVAHITHDRANIAKELDCPIQLLQNFIEFDSEIEVVLAAATNARCPAQLLPMAAERTKVPLRELLLNHSTLQASDSTTNRDAFILSHILKDGSNIPVPLSTNTVPVIAAPSTYKAHVTLVMCPAWGVAFAPYNIAKLAGLLRANEYKVSVIDLNIKAHTALLTKTTSDLWDGNKHWLWSNQDNFNKEILPLLKGYILEVVESICKLKPDVLGFSLYGTNMWCTSEVVRLVKLMRPDIPIIVGGPQASQYPALEAFAANQINYVFRGEAEESFLTFLENKEYLVPAEKQVIGTYNSRLILDNMPFPDYSDYNLTEYALGSGCSSETSRGCVAQCSFCGEYQFWKFRTRSPRLIVDELKIQKEKYGITRVWFVDSLINGNLNVFRELVDLLIEEKINIIWNCYARCDDRMTLEFAYKVAASGCDCLSFGVESGSQKVLDDMRKKIKVSEIYENLKNFHTAKVTTHVNYVIGFPTEDNLDFLHGLNLIWNSGEYINSISPGGGCGAPDDSDLALSWKDYGYAGKDHMYDTLFLGEWCTVGYKNTKLHRMVRLKLMSVLLEFMTQFYPINNGQRYNDVTSFYNLTYNTTKITSYIESMDNLDLNVFKTNNQISLAESVANEFVGIGWLLFKILNTSFNLTINFNPAVDFINFGSYITADYSGTINISVTSDGNAIIDVDHALAHEALTEHSRRDIANEKQHVGDMSFKEHTVVNFHINDLVTEYSMVTPTVKEKKKTIPIKMVTN